MSLQHFNENFNEMKKMAYKFNSDAYCIRLEQSTSSIKTFGQSVFSRKNEFSYFMQSYCSASKLTFELNVQIRKSVSLRRYTSSAIPLQLTSLPRDDTSALMMCWRE